MPSTKILLTGATGYIGGTVLSQLLQHPDAASFEITAFLRSAEKAEKLKLLGVQTIVGSFVDDRDAFVEAVASSDIVFSVASSDDLPAAQAALEGAKKYHERTGKAPALIHTSGSAIITDDARGLTSEYTTFSDLDVETLNAIPETVIHRNVDISLIQADKEGYVKTYIITPTSVFGYPTGLVRDAGIQNIHSVVLLWMTRACIQRKQAGYIGKGLNKCCAVDANETAEIYIILLNSIRSNTPGVGHGTEGYYFAENFAFAVHERGKAMAEVFYKHGISSSPEPSSISPDEAEKLFGPIWPLLGANVYVKADRARALGWKPTKGTQDWVAYVKDEVALIISEGQK